MDTMKKLGLTALAGSLVATSAYAGEMSVSGSAKVTYTSQDEKEVTGNGFSSGKGLTFSGSGDLDNISTIYPCGVSASWQFKANNNSFKWLSFHNIKPFSSKKYSNSCPSNPHLIPENKYIIDFL